MATGHLEKRYNSSWTIVIDKGRDENGERDRITKNCKGTKSEAKAEMLRMLKEIEDGTYVKPTKLTTLNLLSQWLEDHKSQLAPRTYESYEMVCRVHLGPALGVIPLSDLKPVNISKYKTDKLKTDLSPKTVGYHMMILQKALDFAVKMQLLRINPAKAVDKPKAERHKFPMPTSEDIARLLEVAQEYAIYPIIFTALYTGMRLGEVLALHWEDVDLDEGTIHIRRKVQRIKSEEGSELVFSEPKAHSVGIIDISSKLAELLKEQKDAHPDSVLVFPTKNGTPYEVKNVSAKFKKIATEAKIDFTFHGLRHTHASILLDAGEPLPVVQERLRHKQPSTTADIYSHVLPHRQRRAADRFEQALDGQRGNGQRQNDE